MRSFKKIHWLLFITIVFMCSSCRLWEKVFPPKYGCGTNGGRNVGAEKLLQGETKKKKKESKFRG